MKSSIYLPLASNAAWFENSSTVELLERQLKLSIVFYDEVLLEDGRLQLICGKDGQGMSPWWPADSFPGERTAFSFVEKGGDFSVAMGKKVIMASKADLGFEVDFLPIIHRADIGNQEFIKWQRESLQRSIMIDIERNASNDLFAKKYDRYLPKNAYFRKELLKRFYCDSTVAQLLGLSVLVDSNCGELAYGIAESNQDIILPSLPTVAADVWRELKLPDFSSWSWKSLIEFRQSASGRDFRRMIDGVITAIEGSIAAGASIDEIRHEIRNAVVAEVVSELGARTASPVKTGISLGLNLIPNASLISVGKDLVDHIRDKRSWVTVFTKTRNCD